VRLGGSLRKISKYSFDRLAWNNRSTKNFRLSSRVSLKSYNFLWSFWFRDHS